MYFKTIFKNYLLTSSHIIFLYFYYLQTCDAAFDSITALNKHTKLGNCTQNQDWKDIYTEHDLYSNQEELDLETGATIELETDGTDETVQLINEEEDEQKEEEEKEEEDEENQGEDEETEKRTDHTYSLPKKLNLDGTLKSRSS